MLWPRTFDDITLLVSGLWLLALPCFVVATRQRTPPAPAAAVPGAPSSTGSSPTDSGEANPAKSAASSCPQTHSAAAAVSCAPVRELIQAHAPPDPETPEQATLQPPAAAQLTPSGTAEGPSQSASCLTTAAMPLPKQLTGAALHGTSPPAPDSQEWLGNALRVSSETPYGALAITPLLNEWLTAAFEHASASGSLDEAWFQGGLSVAWLLEALTMCTRDLEKVRATGASAMVDAEKRAKVEDLVVSLKDVTRLLRQQTDAAAAHGAAPVKPRKGKAARNRPQAAASKVQVPREDPLAACRRVRECLNSLMEGSGAVVVPAAPASPPAAPAGTADAAGATSPLSAASPPVFMAERASVPEEAKQRAARQRRLITKRLARPRSAASPILANKWGAVSAPVFNGTPERQTCEAFNASEVSKGPLFPPAHDASVSCIGGCLAFAASGATKRSGAEERFSVDAAVPPVSQPKPRHEGYPLDALECKVDWTSEQLGSQESAVLAGLCLLDGILEPPLPASPPPRRYLAFTVRA